MKKIIFILFCLLNLNLFGAAEEIDVAKVNRLFSAIEQGDAQAVKEVLDGELVSRKINLVDQLNVFGNSALFIAVHSNNPEIVKILCTKYPRNLDETFGADRKTALHIALENMAKFNNRNLHELQCAREIAQTLVAYKARIDVEDSSNYSQLQLAEKIYIALGYKEPYDLMQEAKLDSARRSVKDLICEQAMSSQKTNGELIDEWFNYLPGLIKYKDYFLNKAISENSPTMVSYFLDKGAQVDNIDCYGTPLHFALRKLIIREYDIHSLKARANIIKIIATLLHAGADYENIKCEVEINEFSWHGNRIKRIKKSLTPMEYLCTQYLGEDVTELFDQARARDTGIFLSQEDILPKEVSAIIVDYIAKNWSEKMSDLLHQIQQNQKSELKVKRPNVGSSYIVM